MIVIKSVEDSLALRNEACVEISSGELRVRQQRRLKRDAALHATDYERV